MSDQQLTSPVLTNEEACQYLRLDQDHPNMGDAVRALQRLARERGLRPLEYGRSYKWLRSELDRFIAAEQERGIANPQVNPPGASATAINGVRPHQKPHPVRRTG